MNPAAIVFDAFGTLLQRAGGRHPYRQLFQLAKAAGRRPQATDAEYVMAHPVGLAATAAWLGIHPSMSELALIETDLQADLKAVAFFEDAGPALVEARILGLKIAVCSNLAVPYGLIVRALLSEYVDTFVFSYDVGTTKPDPRIYSAVCDALNMSPDEIFFVGDTHGADVMGPRKFGMQAVHLVRAGDGPSPDPEFVTTLADLSIVPAKTS